MDKFKNFYYERKGKYILFFGFYLIFFIFLGLYIHSFNNNKPVEKQQVQEKITTYDISNLINNDYSYTIDIIDNSEIIKFNGTKNNIDYANYDKKYFLDIYNINQLLKRSKLKDSDNSKISYELENKDINNILLTDVSDGINIIEVYINEKSEVNKIILDLTNYFNQEKYQITITYAIGEEYENSSS